MRWIDDERAAEGLCDCKVDRIGNSVPLAALMATDPIQASRLSIKKELRRGRTMVLHQARSAGGTSPQRAIRAVDGIRPTPTQRYGLEARNGPMGFSKPDLSTNTAGTQHAAADPDKSPIRHRNARRSTIAEPFWLRRRANGNPDPHHHRRFLQPFRRWLHGCCERRHSTIRRERE